ncbi:unnamed protein product, partial [Gongylonema pulchrum]|uniref:PXA domain-containing protein n=1 Tax=Gongylonema pulchrum TaxID=637853 RepID=A0A183D9C6_9BILA
MLTEKPPVKECIGVRQFDTSEFSIFRFIVAAVNWERKISKGELHGLDDCTRNFQFSSGNEGFLSNRERFSENALYEQEQSMTNCATLDAILEQILSFVIRDFVDSWYSGLTTDHLFKESLKRSARRTVAAFSQCIRKMDFVPLLTQHIIDDIASHFRLFRKAKERAQVHYGKSYTTDDLETMFFDLELEME